MRTIELTNVEEFENLKKGDRLLVKWSKEFKKYYPKAKNIELYSIAYVSTKDHEVICRRKDNHYFHYLRYLNNQSWALSVLKIIE